MTLSSAPATTMLLLMLMLAGAGAAAHAQTATPAIDSSLLLTGPTSRAGRPAPADCLIPACLSYAAAACRCAKCAAIAGCAKTDPLTCRCLAAKAGYAVLDTGLAGCSRGYGAFLPLRWAGMKRSAMPSDPPSCPASPLVEAAAAAAAAAAKPTPCACKACPAKTTSVGGVSIDESGCFGGAAPAFTSAPASGGGRVTALQVWYSARLGSVTGVLATFSDGSEAMAGQALGDAKTLAVPDGDRIISAFQRQAGLQITYVEFGTAAGALLWAGNPRSSAPRSGLSAPANGTAALSGFTGWLAYPDGPVVQLAPTISGACLLEPAAFRPSSSESLSSEPSLARTRNAAPADAWRLPSSAPRDVCSITGCIAYESSSRGCQCRKCAVIVGCAAYWPKTCRCARAKAGYRVLATGLAGCDLGFGSFTAGNLTGVARSTLPIVPPTCPPSPLPSARAVAPPACLCKPCPRGTSSAFSGLPIEVAACFVPSAPTFARRGSAYVTGLAVYYHAALATIFGVEATYADGTRLLSGVRTGSVQNMTLPDGGGTHFVKAAFAQTGTRLLSIGVADANGDWQFAGNPNTTADPADATTAPAGTGLSGFTGAAAYPGGPILSLAAVFSAPCAPPVLSFDSGGSTAGAFVAAVTAWFDADAGAIVGLRHELSDGGVFFAGSQRGDEQYVEAPKGITAIKVRATASPPSRRRRRLHDVNDAPGAVQLLQLVGPKGAALGSLGDEASAAPEQTFSEDGRLVNGFSGTLVAGAQIVAVAPHFVPNGTRPDSVCPPATPFADPRDASACVECLDDTNCAGVFASDANVVCAAADYACACANGTSLNATTNACESDSVDCAARGLVPLPAGGCGECVVVADCLTTANFTDADLPDAVCLPANATCALCGTGAAPNADATACERAPAAFFFPDAAVPTPLAGSPTYGFAACADAAEPSGCAFSPYGGAGRPPGTQGVRVAPWFGGRAYAFGGFINSYTNTRSYPGPQLDVCDDPQTLSSCTVATEPTLVGAMQQTFDADFYTPPGGAAPPVMYAAERGPNGNAPGTGYVIVCALDAATGAPANCSVDHGVSAADGSAAPGANFDRPEGIAVFGDRVYVANQGQVKGVTICNISASDFSLVDCASTFAPAANGTNLLTAGVRAVKMYDGRAYVLPNTGTAVLICQDAANLANCTASAGPRAYAAACPTADCFLTSMWDLAVVNRKAYVVDYAPSGSLVTCDDAATLSRCRASPAPAANASYVDEGSNLLYKITRMDVVALN